MNKAVSAGGIVVRRMNGEFRIPMVVFERGDITFPKGHVEIGETIEEAGVREFKEETGIIDVRVIKKLGVITRRSEERTGEIVLKDIHLFLLVATDFTSKKHDEHIEWFTINEAIERMAFQEDRDFLIKIRTDLEATP